MGTDGSTAQQRLPSGLLSFLFSDIEDSTPRWEANPHQMRDSLAAHDAVARRVVEAHNGIIFNHTGDGITAVFLLPDDAADAAVAYQEGLQDTMWPGGDRLKVRIGLHSGVAEPTGDQYFGIPLNRAARIMDAANGDQISLSGAMAYDLPDRDVRSCGPHLLKGVGSEELFLLHDERLLEDTRPLRSSETPSIKPLPIPVGDLVGRERELAGLNVELNESRLITLIGPGGVGKTRLAIEAARRRAERYELGPAYCDLGAVVEAGSVAEVVAQAVGARRQPDLSLLDSIAAYLEGRSALLVLDNCEHVLDEVVEIADRLLSIEGPVMIATSRQPLGLFGREQRWPVEPLPATGSGFDLFLERARQRDPHLEVDAEAERAIRQICDRLDGLPAAIELAAARLSVLSPTQLLDALEDVFGLLRPARGDQTRSLVDTVKWSHDDLNDDERALFDRLAVFPTSFSLEAASAVGAAESTSDAMVLDALQSLVDKSMIVPVRGGAGVRFRMLQTLRAYGAAQLEEAGTLDEVRLQHAEWFRNFAYHESKLLMTGKEAEVWEHLTAEWDNLRAAFDVLIDHDFDAALLLVHSLAWYATFALRFELFSWAGRLLDDPRAAGHPDRAPILGTAALGAYFFADRSAPELAVEALELDPAEPSGLARGALASIYLNNLHASADAEAVTAEWISKVDESSTPENRLWAMALRVFHLALLARPSQGENPSIELAEQTHALAHRSGSASAIALGQWAIGLSKAGSGDLPAAFVEWEHGLDVAASLGSQHLMTHLLRGLLAHWSAPVGDLEDVLQTNCEYLELAIEHDYLTGTSHLLGVVAIALSRAGMAGRGAALLGAMEANGHVPRYPAVPMVQKELGDGYPAAVAVGSHWSVRRAGDEAVAAMTEALEQLRAVG